MVGVYARYTMVGVYAGYTMVGVYAGTPWWVSLPGYTAVPAMVCRTAAAGPVYTG